MLFMTTTIKLTLPQYHGNIYLFIYLFLFIYFLFVCVFDSLLLGVCCAILLGYRLTSIN